MKSLTAQLLLAATIVVGSFAVATESKAAEWRWAKPLNQKPGSLLYTTNIRAKQKTTSSTVQSWGTSQNRYRTTLPRRTVIRGLWRR